MSNPPLAKEILQKMTAPADLFTGTGSARPIAVQNIIAFCRTRARELGTRKSFHHRFVLCFNLHEKASINLILNNVPLRLDPDRYILFAPHQLHTYANLDEREISVLFVTFETEDGDLLYHLCDRIMRTTPAIGIALRAFVEEYAGSRPIRRNNIIALHAQILLETLVGNDFDSGIEAHANIPILLKEAMAYLSGVGSATAMSIAKEIGVSEAYLRKLFKRHIGISLGRYLMEMRQNKARSMLGASDESISRIAELCGYKSIYAFSRSFRAFNECTPSRYRERSRKPSTK